MNKPKKNVILLLQIIYVLYSSDIESFLMDNSTFLDSEEFLLNVEDDFSSDQLIPSRQNFSSFLEAVRKSDHINLRTNFVSFSLIFK